MWNSSYSRWNARSLAPRESDQTRRLRTNEKIDAHSVVLTQHNMLLGQVKQAEDASPATQPSPTNLNKEKSAPPPFTLYAS
jgi:hypothetical protein